MSFEVIINDITNVKADVIFNSLGVNTTNYGGICKSIVNKAESQELVDKLKEINGKHSVGYMFFTDGYKTNAKKILHIIAPKYDFDKNFKAIESCLKAAFVACKNAGLKTIAVPIIGTGANGYPGEAIKEMTVMMASAFANTFKGFNVYVVFAPEKISVANKVRLSDSRHSEEELQMFKQGVEDFVNSLPNEGNVDKERFDFSSNYFLIANPPFQKEGIIEFAKPKRALKTVKEYLQVFLDHKNNYHINQTDYHFAKIRLFLATSKNDPKSGSRALSRYTKGTVPDRESLYKIMMACEMNIDEAQELFRFCGYQFVTENGLEKLKSDIIILSLIKAKKYKMEEIEATFKAFGLKSIFAPKNSK